MKDIVDQLREHARGGGFVYDALIDEAADEIERLRLKVKEHALEECYRVVKNVHDRLIF